MPRRKPGADPKPFGRKSSHPPCVNCGTGAGCRPHGLCGLCYNDKPVRLAYYKKAGIESNYKDQSGNQHHPNAENIDSMEAIEKMIAEQMLTAWWVDQKTGRWIGEPDPRCEFNLEETRGAKKRC